VWHAPIVGVMRLLRLSGRHGKTISASGNLTGRELTWRILADSARVIIAPHRWTGTARRHRIMTLDESGLQKASRQLTAQVVPAVGSHFREHFVDGRRRFVSTENPYRIDKRLAVQRATFLCPGDVRSTFVENLEALLETRRAKRIA
jgi:hypothetical protein